MGEKQRVIPIKSRYFVAPEFEEVTPESGPKYFHIFVNKHRIGTIFNKVDGSFSAIVNIFNLEQRFYSSTLGGIQSLVISHYISLIRSITL